MSAIVLGTATAGTAHAALGFDVSVGAGVWSQQPSGYVHYSTGGQASSDVNLKNDLGLSSKSQGYAWVDIQHPIPVLPDVEIRYSRINTSGSQVLSRTITYGGQTYNANQQVNSQVKLTQTDFLFYYQPINNVVQLRLGLDVKAMSLSADISSGNQYSSASGTAAVPMLYAGLRANLPFTGLSAAADGSYIGNGSDYFADYQARLAYETPIGLGLQAGYRVMELRVGNSRIDPNGDIKFKGAFAGVFYQF
ncbi:hypothetical protein BJI67_08510 [Acidihalobacter aeolianus]|uniref:TIGR04219 family outer membrane beta-barrel protein n=2 Tax=Acidihalobacter aeolianus TaxID=2792603 RepID=A0A1D8K825_9GAMM|nr:hypothetical protein BJI67_08510 [Acidihalobacter aeolianus]